MSLNKLPEPLLEAVRTGAIHRCQRYVLCAHDWSLDLAIENIHVRKIVTRSLTKQMLAYDLQSNLLIDDQIGQPIALVAP